MRITHDELYEMSRIGYMGNYEVYVNTDDSGRIPHFHFRQADDWSNHTCIRIDKPKYFGHTGKEYKLNSKERKELNKWLHQTNKKAWGKTNYEVIVVLWNINNSGVDVELNYDYNGNLIIPDYTNIEE